MPDEGGLTLMQWALEHCPGPSWIVLTGYGTFDTFIWGFVDGRPLQNSWKSLKEVPAHTSESDAMSKELKRRGFRFAGSTICYAFMQAVGMVNDHQTDCFRYESLTLE